MQTNAGRWEAPCHFFDNVFLFMRQFAVPMSARSSTPLLPWRLASSSGGFRWDTRSLRMRYYLPRVHPVFLQVSTGFLLRLFLVPSLSSSLLGFQVSFRRLFSVTTVAAQQLPSTLRTFALFWTYLVAVPLCLRRHFFSRPLSSPSCSLQASSSSGGPLCAPLVALPLRGDVSDGCCVTPGVSSGSVHTRQRSLDGVSFVFVRMCVCFNTRGGLFDPVRSNTPCWSN